jgi:magnesium chelatase accessory protein
LIEGTGSKIDRAGLEDYRRLLCTTGHVAGALGMMANWDLHPLVADLPRLTSRLTLLAAENDRAVPPRVAEMVKRLAPASRLIHLPGLGHLAHEEAPAQVAEIVRHETLDG